MAFGDAVAVSRRVHVAVSGRVHAYIWACLRNVYVSFPIELFIRA